MNRFFKGIGIFLGLVGVGIVSALAVIALLLRQEEVRVPDLIGKDVVSVIEIVSSVGLQLAVDRREPSQSVAKDAIVSQSPLPGAGIKKGRKIRIVVSTGPRELFAPKVIGEAYRKADITLRQAGVAETFVSRVWSDTVERDMVIAQDPPPNAPIEKGGKVGILVSLGRKPRVYVTPKLVGRKAEEAVRLVDRMGMQYRIIAKASAAGKTGSVRIVTSQKPLAGYPLPADAVVELTVSK
jgi:serine/threonine-protein kinase